MAGRINERPKGVNWNSGWPYAALPGMVTSKGEWTLGISITPDAIGAVAYYPTREEPPALRLDDGTIWGLEVKFRPFFRVGSPEEAEKFCGMFCSQGYYTASTLKHQGGTMWWFNWGVPTLTTVRMASQIAKKFFSDDCDGAWHLGRAFEHEIRTAENALHEAARG